MSNLQESLKILGSARVKKGESVESACRSDRMNAIMDAIAALARGDNIGRGINIRKRTGDGMVILSGMPGGASGAGRGESDPFSVYGSMDNTEPPFPILKVYPGKISGIIPTLAGAKLDVSDDTSGLHPWFYPPGAPFSFFLRCKIDVDPGNLFRSSVTEVKVVTDDDPSAAGDIDPTTGEITESKITWEAGEEETKTKGHFYLKIADVDMATVDGVQVFKGKTQWLFDSITTFIAVGDYVEVIN